MLSSIIIGGDEDLVRYLRQVSADFADVWIYKVLGETARRYEVVAALNSYTPDVVFLDVTNLGSPDSVASLCLDELLPQRSGTVILPFCGRDTVLAGEFQRYTSIGPLLRPPYNADDLDAAIREGMRRSRPTTHESQVVAVLPAKPGSGATTIALHLAASAASTYGQKTLLLEADLDAGVLMYMLNLEPAHFVSEALQTRLDTEAQWKSMVTRCHRFDLLPASGASEGTRASRWDLSRLLNLAREHYDTIVVDLPSQVDDVAETILREADHAILVSTPDQPSLNLTRRRLFELERRGVPHQHLQLLVNRVRPGKAEPAAMADITRHPINASLPDDSASLEAAAHTAGLSAARSRFARQVDTLAGSLLGLEAEPTGFGLHALRNLLGSALPTLAPRTVAPSVPGSQEGRHGFYHSGGRRQLDRR